MRRPTGDEWEEMEPWEEYMVVREITVYEPEDEKTGLLDADGHPLVRVRNPIGFLADL